MYGCECFSNTQDFELFKTFKLGREMTDDARSQQLFTSITEANIQTLRKLISENRRLNVRDVAELTESERVSVLQIMPEIFNINNTRSFTGAMCQLRPLCL